ncbi:MAG: glycosyltransferase family 39 protein [Isosphaeraceae bacterium]
MNHEPVRAAADRRTIRGIVDWMLRPRSFRPSYGALACAFVAIGVALRIWEYFEFRQIYMDEGSLLKNIVGRSIFDFRHVLEDDQMAPPAFLVIERLLVRLPMSVKAAGRLFPLLCGVATVFLTYAAARRYLDPRAVPIAVALFALSDHLLYYSAEIKQYSCDLMFSLIAILLAAPPPPGEMGPQKFRALAVFGLVAPWFSFPVVFALAAVGSQILLNRLRLKERGAAIRMTAIGLAWVASFAGCYLLSRSILSRRDFIWVWWNFAFLPIPPRSLAELSLLGETFANVFINPVGILSPLPLPYTAALASILWLFGAFSLGLRWPGGLLIVAGPLPLALASSALHLYPFHGRLLIYLVPALLLPMAEGMAAIGRRTGWPATLLLATLFIYGEAAEIFWHKTILARARTFDSHGDLKNDLLDHLEYQRKKEAEARLRAATARDPSR